VTVLGVRAFNHWEERDRRGNRGFAPLGKSLPVRIERVPRLTYQRWLLVGYFALTLGPRLLSMPCVPCAIDLSVPLIFRGPGPRERRVPRLWVGIVRDWGDHAVPAPRLLECGLAGQSTPVLTISSTGGCRWTEPCWSSAAGINRSCGALLPVLLEIATNSTCGVLPRCC